MIEVIKDNSYRECINCGSSVNVLFISFGDQHKESIKLCTICIDEFIKKVEE